MLKIVIKDAEVITTKVNGKSGVFESTSQTGWVDLPSGERRKLRIRLGRDAKPYAAGEYQLGDASYNVSEYGDLGLGNLALVPITATSAQPRAVG